MKKCMKLEDVIQLAEVPFEFNGKIWVSPFSFTLDSTNDMDELLKKEKEAGPGKYICWTDDYQYDFLSKDEIVIVDTDVIEKCEKAFNSYIMDNIYVPIEERPNVPNLLIVGLEGEYTPKEIVDDFLKKLDS